MRLSADKFWKVDFRKRSVEFGCLSLLFSRHIPQEGICIRQKLTQLAGASTKLFIHRGWRSLWAGAFLFSFRFLRVDSLLLFLRFCTIPPITRWPWIVLDEDISVSFFSLSRNFLVLPANGQPFTPVHCGRALFSFLCCRLMYSEQRLCFRGLVLFSSPRSN